MAITNGSAQSSREEPTVDVLREVFQSKFPGVKLSERDEKDYLVLLQATHRSLVELEAEPGEHPFHRGTYHTLTDVPVYNPHADLERFPRVKIHQPRPEENKNNAWVMRVEVKDTLLNEDDPAALLKGQTFAAKDNCAVAGVETRNGTNFAWVPEVDAEVVTRCLKAGAILLGKGVAENNSGAATSDTSRSGTVHNPYCYGRTTGGSSSGCAALVAGGEVDFAIGGDQGGSIRNPSAHCGLVGLKPTFGLVPYTGILSVDHPIDHTGPMTKNVMDNARVLASIAGADGIDGCQGPGVPLVAPKYHEIILANKGKSANGLKIGLIQEGFDWPFMDPRYAEKVKSAAQLFTELGATVETISIPRHKRGHDLRSATYRASLAQSFVGHREFGHRQAYLAGREADIEPWTQQKYDETYFSVVSNILGGAYGWDHFGPGLYGKLMNLLRSWTATYDEQLTKYDILITPTGPYVAPPHVGPGQGPIQAMSKGPGQTHNTGIFNATGHPAMSLPVGMLVPQDGGPGDGTVKLPVGMQMIGRKFDESTLYRAAYAWEQAYNWKDQ